MPGRTIPEQIMDAAAGLPLRTQKELLKACRRPDVLEGLASLNEIYEKRLQDGDAPDDDDDDEGEHPVHLFERGRTPR